MALSRNKFCYVTSDIARQMASLSGNVSVRRNESPGLELKPRRSRYEHIRSRFSIKPLGNIRTRFVDHHVNIVPLRAQLPVAALNSLAVIPFCLDN